MNNFEMISLDLFKSEDFDSFMKFEDSLSFHSTKVRVGMDTGRYGYG